MIIYPPLIDATIPAFVGSTVKIPFQQNPAVNYHEITGFALIIKNYTDATIVLMKKHSRV